MSDLQGIVSVSDCAGKAGPDICLMKPLNAFRAGFDSRRSGIGQGNVEALEPVGDSFADRFQISLLARPQPIKTSFLLWLGKTAPEFQLTPRKNGFRDS